jgi:hypothetical protein
MRMLMTMMVSPTTVVSERTPQPSSHETLFVQFGLDVAATCCRQLH